MLIFILIYINVAKYFSYTATFNFTVLYKNIKVTIAEKLLPLSLLLINLQIV